MEQRKSIKGRIIFFGILLFVIIIALIFVLTRPRPVDGEIFEPDFKGGYEVYVQENYRSYLMERTNQYGKTEKYYEIEPFGFWHINDKGIKSQVLKLCSQIEAYRQDREGAYMGMKDVIYTPLTIWMDCGKYGYRIRIYDWESGNEHRQDGWKIFNEISEAEGVVVVHFDRMDMSFNTENEPIYQYRGDDFMDTTDEYATFDEVTYGWHSTMPVSAYNELLELIDTLNASNSDLLE